MLWQVDQLLGGFEISCCSIVYWCRMVRGFRARQGRVVMCGWMSVGGHNVRVYWRAMPMLLTVAIRRGRQQLNADGAGSGREAPLVTQYANQDDRDSLCRRRF